MKAHTRHKAFVGAIFSYEKFGDAQDILARDRFVEPAATHHWLYRPAGIRSAGWSRFTRSSQEPSWSGRAEYMYDPLEGTEWVTGTKEGQNIGATYWCVNPCAPDGLHEGIWENAPDQQRWLEQGLVFWNYRQAVIARDAIMRFLKSAVK